MMGETSMTTDVANTQTNASAMTPAEHTFTLPDGTELFYRAWLPAAPASKALLLFHRGHEHSGRFQDVIEELALPEFAFFAWDARGHGRSPGERGYAPSFSTIVKDMDLFVRHVAEKFGIAIENMAVLAPSVGAVTVATWVHDYAPPIRAMVLAAPAFRVKLYVPLAIPTLRLRQWWEGEDKRRFLTSYVKAKMLTHDAAQAQRYNDDPLITKNIAVNILIDLYDASTRLIDDAGAIRTPTLVMVGGADWVVKRGEQELFFDRLGSPMKQMRQFPGMYHDLLHEKERRLVLDEAREFILEAFEQPTAAPLLNADRRGYTREEYERLRNPLPLTSPRRWFYGAQKVALTTLGRLSQGVRVGFKTGFDSGQSLDYVYRNTPEGAVGVGTWIDKGYLDSVGWKGIRQRKVNLEAILQEAIRRVRETGQPVRVLDIATGCGRYVLETLAKVSGDDLSALLRDNVQANLDQGAKLAATLGLADKVTFRVGDAFDGASLASVEPTPNVAIVSGLYELFGDNSRVLGSLQGVSQAMRDGGYLIYTGQPWHPQVESIARVLPNRDGEAWVMRRRTQLEMDDLVRAAGFEKIDMLIDRWGIFTVSLARKGKAS
jgi:alpha-beta hydrolase superfamily lysophospholipase/SAM-dependent methyltransferase